MIKETSIRLDRYQKSHLWALASRWRKSFGATHDCIIAADMLQAYIVKLLNEAYQMGKEDACTGSDPSAKHLEAKSYFGGDS